MKFNYAYCIDMGGTYLKGAIVNNVGDLVTNVYQVPANSSGSLIDYINSFKQMFNYLDIDAQKQQIFIDFVALSVPGPFDYEKGISKMVHKYQAIYNLNLRQLFLEKLNIHKPMFFENDVISFLLGESKQNQELNTKNICAITLGTGLGYVVMKRKKIYRNDLGSPQEYIYDKKFKDGIMEDYFSARGMIRFYKMQTNQNIESSKAINDLANRGNYDAIETLKTFGTELGKGLLPYLEKNEVSELYIGGQVSKAYPYFIDTLQNELKNINVHISKNENSALSGLGVRFFEK